VSAVTEITSVSSPTPSFTFTTATSPAVSTMPVCSYFLKPDSSALTRYLPSGSSGAR
jgi:hypothetical protein